MLRIPAGTILLATVVLLATFLGFAEYSARASLKIPDLVFFGVPVASIVCAFIAFRWIRAAQAADAKLERFGNILLGIALVVTLLTAVGLRDHYLGNYNPTHGKVAPDGTAVISISWRQEGGRYIERLNNRFDVELTEAQYSDKIRRHQRVLTIVPIVFAILAVLVSAAGVVLDRKRHGHGS